MTTDALPQSEANDELVAVVAELFAAYARPICAYIHSLTGDWQLAHDLTQETYLQLHRTRQRLTTVENQRAWVYRIASHVALNALKRRRRFVWLPWGQAAEEWPAAWAATEHVVTQRDAVERALAQLPLDYRAALLLYSGYEFSVREVAAALGISEGAVKVRLYRARQLFRQVYDGDVP